MKTDSIKTRTYIKGQSFEEEVSIRIFEDIQEALVELGSEECVRMINLHRIHLARVRWRENKFKELCPPTKRINYVKKVSGRSATD